MNFIKQVVRNKLTGKVERVICQYLDDKLTFIKEKGRVNEIFNPERSYIQPDIYRKIISQAGGAFKDQTKQNAIAAKKEKIKRLPVKKEVDLLAIASDNVYEQALHLNQVTADYLEAHPTLSRTQAVDRIIRQRKNSPLRRYLLTELERRWLNNLTQAKIIILTYGWLRITRWDKKISKKPRLLKLKVSGINSAIRMQDDILNQYKLEPNGEILQLENIEAIIDKANHLLTDWSLMDKTAKEQLQKKLASIVLRLENCRNEFKVEAKEQIEKTISLKDSLDRINPGVMATRTITALADLSKRFNELGIIMPVIALRKELLIFEKRREENLMKKALAETKNVLNHQVFKGKIVADYEPRFLVKDINRALAHLTTAWAAPYFWQTRQASLYLEQAKIFILAGKFTETQTMLKTSLSILTDDMKGKD